MNDEKIEVSILSAEKETNTFWANGEVREIVTVSVTYEAAIIIQGSGCEIEGTFKYKDDHIMDETWIKQRIAGLFKEVSNA